MKLTQQKTITRAVKGSLGADFGWDRKPYFCPLKKEYYFKIKSGEQDCEIRPNKHRGWNEENIYIGRDITFSLGYGKADRTTKTIKDIACLHDLSIINIPQWHIDAVIKIYGNQAYWLVAYV